MDDHERHEFIQPPGPPMFGRGSPLAGPDPKRRPDAELAEGARRHSADGRAAPRSWWKRLLRRA